MAPEPDIRAKATPGAARNAASTSLMTGTKFCAGTSRSLRCLDNQSNQASRFRGSGIASKTGGFCFEASALNTAGVDTPCRGLTKIMGNCGGGPNISNCSPIPRIRVNCDDMQTGISAPSCSSLLRAGTGCDHSCDKARIVAAASLEPPPIPDEAGRFFSNCICAPLEISNK